MYEWLFLIAAPFLAILSEGLFRKMIARMQNRQGPPLLQPMYDLFKLWGKKPLRLDNDPFFALAPALYFFSHLALFIFVPLSLVSFEFDFLLIVYLTILGSAFYTLAGVSSDSPYSVIGSMREMILMVCTEIALAIVVVTVFIFEKTLSFASLDASLGFLMLPIAAYCLFSLSRVEVHVTPFDTVGAHPEILSSIELEYPGKPLFFMTFTGYLKKFFYMVFWPLLFVGTGNWLLFAAAALFVLLAYTYSQFTTPRYRVDQAYDQLTLVMVLALIEFVRVSWGLTWAL